MAQPELPPPDRLVLGVDGGGTKTLAWLAAVDEHTTSGHLAQGASGPSNPRAAGREQACRNILDAIEQAFAQVHQQRQPVAAACLALAGTGLPEMRQAIAHWCLQQNIAHRIHVVHDALAVLRAGAACGPGIALIAGTGSLAYGWASPEREARAGGWGYVFGDEGSGFAVGVAALRAVCQAADGRQGPTELTHALLSALELTRPEQLVAALCADKPARQQIAALAPCVTQAAQQGDQTADQILADAADDLAALALSVARQLELAAEPFDLALAGGLLTGCPLLRRRLLDRLRQQQVNPTHVHVVLQPVHGAVRIARTLA